MEPKELHPADRVAFAKNSDVPVFDPYIPDIDCATAAEYFGQLTCDRPIQMVALL